jgi:ribosome-associated toxin RatA of RatAB toxin-antitoxin module
MAQTIRRSAIVPYSPDEMFRLVEDVDRYSEFLNWCSESTIEGRQSSGDDEIVTASVEISYHGLHRRFKTRNTHRAPSRIHMELIEGPFSELTGDWRFTPLGDQGCKIELELVFEFTNLLLGGVVGPIFRQISDGQVDAFHARAVEVYGERSRS